MGFRCHQTVVQRDSGIRFYLSIKGHIMNINIFLAFAAGLISFLSPCIFPVIPSYLSYISGLSISNFTNQKGNKWNLLLNSILFVFGFTIIFIIMGIFFSSIGIALSGISRYINMAAGLIVMFLGFNFFIFSENYY